MYEIVDTKQGGWEVESTVLLPQNDLHLKNDMGSYWTKCRGFSTI